MAATASPDVDLVHKRLVALLQRAKQLKSTNAVEPPLPASAFSGDLGLPPTNGNSKSHSVLVEIAARRIFENQAARTSDLDSDFNETWNLLDILHILGDQDHCEPTLLWYIVEELLDSRSIEGCRKIFDYLESRRERLVSRNFKKIFLVILRACNELLRRLSRAEDAVFCGRVLIFVFQSFPLGDKSSVNRQGDYNTDNVTRFDGGDVGKVSNEVSSGDSVMVDINSTPAAASEETIALDLDELHPQFWGLQKIFAYPPTVLDSNLLSDFKQSFSAILTKFDSVPKVLSAPDTDRQHGIKRKANEIDRDDVANNFNPKYLTSRELFQLELSDLSFQRHILVQAIILLEFLLSFTEKAKKNFNARTQQKYQFTLSKEDAEWATQTKIAIMDSLREGQDGAAFVRMVETVLSRDKNWVRWKEINCPEISLIGIAPNEYSHATSGARGVGAWRKFRPTPDLGFLEESENSVEVDVLTRPERYSIPDTESMVSKVAMVELDLEMATEEEAEILNQQKASDMWRALRTASANKLNRLDKLAPNTNLDALLDKADQEQVPPADGDQDVDAVAAENEGNVTAASNGNTTDNPAPEAESSTSNPITESSADLAESKGSDKTSDEPLPTNGNRLQ